VAKYF
jgi:lipopolysaccharide biosynthesis regulator YciM